VGGVLGCQAGLAAAEEMATGCNRVDGNRKLFAAGAAGVGFSSCSVKWASAQHAGLAAAGV
jgi:hypothetical protein